MRIRRYFFTALIAVLLWPNALYLFKHPLLDLMLQYVLSAAELAVYLVLATSLGIWTVDQFKNWSRGTVRVTGLRAELTRISIALVAASIFSLKYAYFVSALIEMPFNYREAFLHQGIIIIIVVWCATWITDLFVND
jgi:hypothetical protein